MQSIDDGAFVDVNGVPHWLTLRGADRSNPALLLVGGPGSCFAALAPFFADWEREFTLVQWDQPGGGFTFAKSGAEATTVARLVDDGLRVAALARERLQVPKLALLGFSGGTIVGLEMVRRRPELFSAYIGSGQDRGLGTTRRLELCAVARACASAPRRDDVARAHGDRSAALCRRGD